jgi:hypothetical protein
MFKLTWFLIFTHGDLPRQNLHAKQVGGGWNCYFGTGGVFISTFLSLHSSSLIS